jgi:hypothetical protein
MRSWQVNKQAWLQHACSAGSQMLSSLAPLKRVKVTFSERAISSVSFMALVFLQQGYQAGGSDRVELLRRWEFLKYLILTGQLDVEEG